MENTTNIQQGMEETTTVQQEQEKTFTQEELNRTIEKRLERERKKYPSTEELEQFKQWKESQQTQAEKWENLQKERNTFEAQLLEAQKEVTQMKQERYLLSQGIAMEDVDYYAYKIAKTMQDGDDFETAAKKYLTENQKKQNTIVNFGLNTSNQGKSFSFGEQINKQLRGEL